MEREPSSPPSPRSPPSKKHDTANSAKYWSIFSQGGTDLFASPQRGSTSTSTSTPASPHWRKNRAHDGNISIESNGDTVNESTSLLMASPLRNTRTEGFGAQKQAYRTAAAPGAALYHGFKRISPQRSVLGRPLTPLGSSSKKSKTLQPLLLQSMRHWDVALPPLKKHVVGGKLVETFRGSLYGNDRTRNLPVAKRKLTIELFGHDHDTKLWGSRRRRKFSDLENNSRGGYYHCTSGGSSCGGVSCGSGGEDDLSWELFQGASSEDPSIAKGDRQSDDTDSSAYDGDMDDRNYELAERDIVVLRVMKSRTVTQYDDEFGLGDNSINSGLRDRKWESQSMSDRTMSWMMGLEAGDGDRERDDNASFSSGESLMKKHVRWTESSRTRLSQIELVREDFEANEVDLKMGVGARTLVQTFRFDDVNAYGARNKHEGDARTFARLFRVLKWLEKERAQRLAAAHRDLLSERDSYKQEIMGDSCHEKSLGQESNSVGNDSSNGNDIGDDCDLERKKEGANETVSILVEIVSANNLPPPEERTSDSLDGINPHYTGVVQGNDRSVSDPEIPPSSDPYVVIRDGKTDVHTTSFIADTDNPVWTLSTGSLCLLQSNLVEFFNRSNVLEFTVKNHNAMAGVEDQTFGTVMVHKTELLNGTGERKCYQILRPPKSSRAMTLVYKTADNCVEAPYLYLRYRQASMEDIGFMKSLEEEMKRKYNHNLLEDGFYASESFLAPEFHASPLLHRSTEKRGEDGQSPQSRVKPTPDPDNMLGTEWMTETQIEEVSKAHSTSWTMAGSGSIGKLYIEIMGCDGLTNTSQAPGEKIDSFVNIVFEDSIINTDVIHHCLSPRWMPWSQRAFAINLMHLSSLIFVGVFDYNNNKGIDGSADVNHDPLGRAVINISSLRSRAIHTLTYNLYDSDDVDRQFRGTITLRLRLAIHDERKAVLSELSLRDRCCVSTVKGSDFRCASYSLTDNNQPRSLSIRSMTNYKNELLEYIELKDQITDALAVVLLWKGNFPVTLNLDSIPFCFVFYPVSTGRRREIVLNLPLHSMVAFAWATALARNLETCFSFFWFAIGWVFLAKLEDQRRHPSPWRRPRSYTELLRTLLFHNSRYVVLGRPPLRRTIHPNERLGEIERFESHQAEQAAARQNILETSSIERKQHQKRLEEEESKARQDFPNDPVNSLKSNQTNDEMTPSSDSVLEPFQAILLRIQKILCEACRMLRVCSSAFLWKDSYLAFWITSLSFSASFVAFWIPWAWLIQWGFRLFVWPFFGPWMKVVDIFYFQKRKNHKTSGENIVFQSETKILAELYNRMLGQEECKAVSRENALKDKDTKRYMFGKYSMMVPIFQELRYSGEPAVSSSSVPYNTNPRPVHIARCIHGQRLKGDMVPYRDYNSNIGRGNGIA